MPSAGLFSANLLIKSRMTENNKGVASLFLLTFGFGLIAVVVRYLSDFYTQYQQLYLTVGSGFLFSLVVFPLSLKPNRLRSIPTKDWLIMLMRVTFGYLIAGFLYRQSITLTKISNVVFIQGIPFAGIYGWLFFREKFTYKKLALLLLAYCGVLLVSVKDYSTILSFGRGELYSLISAALFSFTFVSRKWQTKFLSNQEITQLLLFLGTLILFAASIIGGEGLPTINTQLLVLLSVLVVGFLNATNLLLINYGFNKVNAVLAGNILTLEGVFAFILAYLFYRELPSSKEILGSTIIVLSVLAMNKLDSKEK